MHLRSATAACLFLAAALPASAQHALNLAPGGLSDERALSFTPQAGLGVANGEARELVYEFDLFGRRGKLSELIWDIENVVMAGGVLSARVTPELALHAGFWAAATKGEGQMEDYDWLYGPDADWTDWSLSDVDVEEAYTFDLNGTYRLLQEKAFALHAMAGYKRMHWAWKDYGIRYIYTEETFRDSVGENDGTTGITYEQTFDIPYVGVAASLDMKPVALSAYAAYSPLVRGEDHDEHLFRGLTFDEEFENGEYLALGASLTWAFAGNWAAVASIEWSMIPEQEADTTISDGAVTETTENTAGIEHQMSLLSLALSYTF